jgi:hypothetical protein
VKISWGKVEVVDDKGDRWFKVKCDDTGREFQAPGANQLKFMMTEYERAFEWFQEFCTAFKVVLARPLE